MFEVSDSKNSPILYLTLKTTDYSGNVSITWPSGIYPDSTNSYFENVETGLNGGSTTIEFSSNSEYSFQFYKNNPETVYSENDFSVKGE